MPSKPAKSNKKEQSARTDSPELASNNLSMAGIAGLLEDHRRALSADFKSAISTLEAKLDRIQATVSDRTGRQLLRSSPMLTCRTNAC
ncbi:hypothetical protein KUCAC02_036127 [Chaenocephalus aceratus]|nr:hypothetical protein KUCAC02_036127 [Chaenocephalus aceratus]